MGRIICSKSGNSDWFGKEMHQTEIKSGALRLIDNTNLPFRKNAFIYVRNSSDSPEVIRPWQVISFSANDYGYFNLNGDNYIVSDSGMIKAENGKNYSMTNNSVVQDENYTSGRFNVVNDSDSSKSFKVKRNGYVIEEYTLAPAGSVEIRYLPRFYILVRDYLKFYDIPAIEEVNTEINFLGIETTDVSVTFSSVYSISLTNIVFA